jgi:spore coat-associated protein N
MRPIATLVLSIAMALAAIGLAVAAPGGLIGGDPELARAELQAASGAVSIANSLEGEAVFSASGLRPGRRVSGTVTIGNDGDRPGRFAVQASDVVDDPGPNQGELSERVELVLIDVTDVQSPTTVYAGTPEDFALVDLGVIAAGAERDYLFRATLPNGGDDDNRFQGASLSLGFEWTAAAVASEPVTTPTPTPNPPTTTTPPVADPTPTTPTTPPAPTTPPPVALADALGMPASTSCVKRGKLTIRLKAPAGAKVVSATVKVNGRTKAKLKGKKAAKPVTLKKLTGTTKLSISIKASDKRTYSAARTYKACKR